MKYRKLHSFNLIMAGLHGLQGVIILLISNDATRNIMTDYLMFNEKTQTLETASRSLFSVHIGILVALFFFLSAVAHLYVATIGRHRYEKNLKKGINKTRWYEYALSASLMIVLIGLLSGIYNFSTLIGLFALTAVMSLMGLVMEVHNQTTKETSWLSFYVGVLAGIVPWVIIALALWASESSAAGDIPTFVYWIFFSIFVFFNSFAINMVLQYKKWGAWRDYLYGERAYIILSLVAKSVLAWQIYAGTLQPA